MQLHLVGGFLGSGKTTAILGAARALIGEGKKVGIITNEQGKHLVDTGFFQSANLPALEVTGGCICCHLDDFKERVAEISESFHPDTLFAESVGSCTDLVATVIKPLLNLREEIHMPTSLSVFADSRLLLRWLQGKEMPFSEGIMYIYEKQIEEAGLLVINKIDLLKGSEQEKILTLVSHKYPDKQIRLQNSLASTEIQEWLELIRKPNTFLAQKSLNLDYDRYAAGEGRFVWFDLEIEIWKENTWEADCLIGIVRKIFQHLLMKDVGIAHLKWLIGIGDETMKFSLTSVDDPEIILCDAENQLSNRRFTRTRFLLNLMAEGDAKTAVAIVDHTLAENLQKNDLQFIEIHRFERVPGYPQPTRRITN